MATLPSERDSTNIVIPSKEDIWPAEGSIVFEDFSMKYRSALQFQTIMRIFAHMYSASREDLPPALKNVNFTVKEGQRIGICGRTGSGKSSTVMALFRAMDQSLVSGRILLDDVDIATVPLTLLRSSLR